MKHAPLSIIIVGAGLSGHAAAIALMRGIRKPLQIVMIEAGDRRGGLAYGRAREQHLLNVRAGQFSVVADASADFAGWARKQVIATAPVADLSGSFLPRDMIPGYLESRLHQAIIANRKTTIMYLTGKVTSISRHGAEWRAHLGLGNWIDGAVMILATGYGYRRKRDLGLDPYGELGSRRVKRAGKVAFIGSGLTFIDAWQRLKVLGFEGKAVAISPSGTLPAPHVRDAVKTIQPATYPGMALAEIVRTLRMQAASLDETQDWRGLINGIREQASLLWQSLSEADKKRFYRHVAPVWQKLRHRVAPDTHASICRDIEAGRLYMRRGRVSTVRKIWNSWQVQVREERAQARLGPFDLVFDCTAPSVRSVIPVVAPLIKDGLGRLGPCGIGLDVDAAGGVKDINGVASRSLFAIGPLGEGALLEITGAPEIVAQAGRMTEVIGSVDCGNTPFRASHPARIS